MAYAREHGLSRLAEMEMRAVRERPVPPRLVAAIIGADTKGRLTPRQRETMVLLASGMTQQEIADEMGIGRETVKRQLRLIYLKLDAHTAIQAINAFLDRA